MKQKGRRTCMYQNVRFVLADSQPGSILRLDYREAFVAANSTQVRARRNVLDLIPPGKLSQSSQDMKQFEIRVFLTFKMLKNQLEV